MAFGIVLAAFGCWVLTAFGGGELLAIAIPTLVPLLFLLSLALPCLCNDDIESEHAHKRHTRGGGGSMQSDYIIIISLPIHLLFT